MERGGVLPPCQRHPHLFRDSAQIDSPSGTCTPLIAPLPHRLVSSEHSQPHLTSADALSGLFGLMSPPEPEVLGLSIIDTWGRIRLHGERLPCDLCVSLAAASTHEMPLASLPPLPAVTPQMPPNIAKCPWGTKEYLAENSWLR